MIRAVIPTFTNNDPLRRPGMVFGKERVAPRCGASQGAGDDVRKPCQAAVPVVSAYRRRASRNLDDAMHRLRPRSCPTERGDDLNGSLLVQVGIRTNFDFLQSSILTPMVGDTRAQDAHPGHRDRTETPSARPILQTSNSNELSKTRVMARLRFVSRCRMKTAHAQMRFTSSNRFVA